MTAHVEIQRTLSSTPERVYDAWLDPEILARFMCPAPGVTVKDVHVDPRVGGAFSLTMMAGQTAIPITGEYRVLDRPNTLAFSWISSRTTADSLVELSFEASGEHTRMTLRHSGFPDASSRDDHAGGWSHIAECLDRCFG